MKTRIYEFVLSVVVISYNTREMTLACLRSVFAETEGVSFEVIVLDNASEDGSANAIAECFPNVRLIESETNLGFAAGNNVAAEEACGEYILLLNPDTVVLGGAIQKLWRFAQNHPEYEIYGGRTVFEDGTLNPSSCWGSMTLWSVFCSTVGLRRTFSTSEFFNSESYGAWKRDSIREVGVVTGCFLLIRSELWRSLGGFRRHYFMYAEEADLCLRASAEGARPAIFPDATIVHHGCASERVEWERQVKVLKGKVTLMRDHWNPVSRALGIGLLSYRALSHWAVYAMLSRLLGKKSYRDRAQIFAQIWRSRFDWRRGYRV